MKLNDSIRDSILEDLDFALSKMEATKDKHELLYFFSAFFGAVHRSFNFEFNEDLVIAHLVLRTTHEALNNRLKALASGNEKNVPLFEEHFSAVIKLSKEFREKIASNKNADNVLKKMAVLGYSATGNGYYLFSKGWLKI